MRQLDENVEERNYAKEPLTQAELDELTTLALIEQLINTRDEVAKANGWKEKTPSKAAFVSAVLEDNNVIRRPVLIRGKKVVVGWNEKAIRAVFA